eukprot:6048982-Prymnesium_polylepis.2
MEPSIHTFCAHGGFQRIQFRCADRCADQSAELFFDRLGRFNGLFRSRGGGGDDFVAECQRVGLAISASARFAPNTDNFVGVHQILRNSRARVIVLLTPSGPDARNLVRTSLAVGVGGEGFVWLGYTWYVQPEHWTGDLADYQRAFRGFLAIENNINPGTPAHDAYKMRRGQLPLMVANGSCSLETDSTGHTHLWAQDHYSNASTPLRSSGDDPQRVTTFDALGYDATFAVAYALHDLIEVQNRTAVVGSELLEALITRVQFEGVTGRVDFYGSAQTVSGLFSVGVLGRL